MKLESFKFQDGKVFWLPEYPEEPGYPCLDCTKMDCDAAKCTEKYNEAIAQSLASAIAVAPEEAEKVKCLIYDSVHPPTLIVNVWQPEKNKVYSAECEMEIKTVYEPLVSKFDLQFGKVPIGTQLSVARQVARLKPKEDIFPRRELA